MRKICHHLIVPRTLLRELRRYHGALLQEKVIIRIANHIIFLNMISNKQKVNKFQAKNWAWLLHFDFYFNCNSKKMNKKNVSNYRKPLSAFNFAASPINCPLYPWFGIWHRGDNKHNAKTTKYKITIRWTMNTVCAMVQ